MEVYIETLSETDTVNIMSCLNNFVKNTDLPKDTMYVITVWEHNIANKYFNSNTPKGAYLIFEKNEDGYK